MRPSPDLIPTLERLISFPSVVGRANSEIVEWVRHLAQASGASVDVIPGPESDRANLFITVGPRDRPGVVLSGHLDVVPAAEPGWTSDPFTVRRDGERLYGRGTSDMKGFVACALAALPALANRSLKRPVHVALSYDEEAGCRGVPHLIAALPGLCALPEGCIVGEPSGLVPVLAHKGKAAARITIVGRSGHSSRPDLGLNAIHGMTPVLASAIETAQRLEAGPLDPRFEPPYSSLQVGVIRGGEAINIVPDRCVAEIEARAIFGMDAATLLDPIKATLEKLHNTGFATEWEPMSSYPALRLDADAPLAALLAELSGTVPLPAVSYGTEAGLYQAAGIDSIICGPGDIARAHRPDEYVTVDELADCYALIDRLGERLSQ